MIRKSLIEFMFEAASIERWNDHIRPSRGFTELDKQAHKMLYAYILGNLSDDIDGLKLIEGGVFEFLHRLILTDIKPPIYHRLMDEKGNQINAWVINSLSQNIDALPADFKIKIEKYFTDKNYSYKEKQILECANYLATNWEFDIIYGMCKNYYGIEDTKREIGKKLDKFSSLECLKKYKQNQNLIGFSRLIGELRFQQRWSRSPRIPATSVMGHTLFVAILAYLCSCEIGACAKRTENNFWGGLFHDMPEVLTRDIVSPVKNSVEGLDEIIKGIESDQMNDIIYPLLPNSWNNQLQYFTQDEFESKIIKDGKVCIVTSDDINKSYNCDVFSPFDGQIIRGCDHFSAYTETYFSHTSGITSSTLRDANKELYEVYQNKIVGNMDFGILFDYFKL